MTYSVAKNSTDVAARRNAYFAVECELFIIVQPKPRPRARRPTAARAGFKQQAQSADLLSTSTTTAARGLSKMKQLLRYA